MKRCILLALLVGALAALLAGAAMAAGPVTPPTQGFGPGMGMRGMDMHAPGTGMIAPGAMVERTSVGPAFTEGQTRPNMGQGQTRPGMMGEGRRGGRGTNR